MSRWLRPSTVAAAAGLLMACGGLPPAEPVPAPAPGSGAVDPGDRWAEARTAGAGTVTVLYVPADGWAYRDAGGRLTGVTVELMRLFAGHVRAAHGVSLDLRFVEEEDWRTFYRRVRTGAGGVFGIGNVTITEARRAELRFSPPYLTNVASLITHADVPELERLEAMPVTFAGLTALAFAGTLHEERLRRFEREHFPGVEVALAGSNREILDRVAGGGYFAYVDAYNYRAAREAGAPLRHHPVADDAAEEFGVIMPLESDWAPVLADFFEHGGGLRRTDAYRALLVEHRGEGLARTLLDAAARQRDAASPRR
jgi:ABC-type amino acid transport substrate-binding protein